VGFIIAMIDARLDLFSAVIGRITSSCGKIGLRIPSFAFDGFLSNHFVRALDPFGILMFIRALPK